MSHMDMTFYGATATVTGSKTLIEVAGKRLLVRLRHCAQVRMETGVDAPIYHWVGEQA